MGERFNSFWLWIKNNSTQLTVLVAVASAVFTALMYFHALSKSNTAKDLAETANKISENALAESKESNKLASEANKIAEKSYQRSDELFAIVNRPYVHVTPLPVTEDKSFYSAKITDKKRLRIGFKYGLENIGKLAATDILVRTEIELYDQLLKKKILDLESEGQMDPIEYLALAPGKLKYIDPFIYLGKNMTKFDAVKITHEMVEESGFLMKVTVDYKSELDKSAAYRVTRVDRVFRKFYWIVSAPEPRSIP